MKRLALAIVASAIAAACSSSTPAGPGPIAAGSASAADAKPSTGVPKNWVAHLLAANEVVPVGTPPRESPAQGQVKFQLSADGLTLNWQLIASNIDNVFMAHIHCCADTANNAPVVLWLFAQPANPQPLILGPQNGLLSSGEATAANLVGSLAGQPLSALIAQMDAGMTYTNVHTNDGITPTNTGPGDFPGGEVRGQNRPAGH
jgi:hypothetical protein